MTASQSSLFDDGVAVQLSSTAPVADYLPLFGLLSDPFDSADSTLFTEAGRQSLLETLEHLLLFGGGLFAVGGSAGVGKTFIKNRLAEHLQDDQVAVVCLSLSANWKLPEFIAAFAAAVELNSTEYQSVGQLLSALRRRLQQLGEEPCCILIDDAHLLDAESLTTLLGLLQGALRGGDGSASALSVALFAEPNFIGRLAVADLGELELRDLLIEPFDDDALLSYMHWRFTRAGAEDQPFSRGQLQQWLAQTAGDLNQIQRLATEWMQLEARADEGAAPALPLLHIGVVAGLLLILAAVYWFAGSKEGAAVVKSVPVAQPLVEQPLQKGAPAVVAGGESGINDDVTPPLSAPLNAQIEQIVVEKVDQPVQLAVDEAVGARDAASVFAPELQKELSDHTVERELEVAEVLEPTPQLPPKSRIESKFQLEHPSQEPVDKQDSAPVAVSLPADEAALMSYRGSDFTLQVLGASTRAGVEEFVARQPNRQVLRIFVTRRNGSEWYVVVAGRYATKAEARAAIAKLPAEQRKAGPWPKSLAMIQQDIRKYRGI